MSSNTSCDFIGTFLDNHSSTIWRGASSAANWALGASGKAVSAITVDKVATATIAAAAGAATSAVAGGVIKAVCDSHQLSNAAAARKADSEADSGAFGKLRSGICPEKAAIDLAIFRNHSMFNSDPAVQETYSRCFREKKSYSPFK